MPSSLTTACAVAGGGPAGMMLGLLLARAGVDVVVMEKHPDFLRDFRGDTVHPSTLEVMYELGLLEEMLKLPHSELHTLGGIIGGETFPLVDFTHLPTHCRFIALMPQWDFLDFLARQGRRYPNFKLMMRTEVTDLVDENGRIAGLKAMGPDGAVDIRAILTVGADGRHSTVRARAGLVVEDVGAPMDVLWLRLSRRASDSGEALGRAESGHIFVTINRGDYWQCAFVIPKGGFADIQRQGLPAFCDSIAQLAPELHDRVNELQSWDDIKLLTVAVDRLRCWHRPGVLCIGDAAHAMSPIGGVGINLAIQDAVAAANILATPLRENAIAPRHLIGVQRRRELPARLTQRLQVLLQNQVIGRLLTNHARIKAPWAMKLVKRFPFLRRLPGRLVGLGVRPEHVRTGWHAPVLRNAPEQY